MNNWLFSTLFFCLPHQPELVLPHFHTRRRSIYAHYTEYVKKVDNFSVAIQRKDEELIEFSRRGRVRKRLYIVHNNLCRVRRWSIHRRLPPAVTVKWSFLPTAMFGGVWLETPIGPPTRPTPFSTCCNSISVEKRKVYTYAHMYIQTYSGTPFIPTEGLAWDLQSSFSPLYLFYEVKNSVIFLCTNYRLLSPK